MIKIIKLIFKEILITEIMIIIITLTLLFFLGLFGFKDSNKKTNARLQEQTTEKIDTKAQPKQ